MIKILQESYTIQVKKAENTTMEMKTYKHGRCTQEGNEIRKWGGRGENGNQNGLVVKDGNSKWHSNPTTHRLQQLAGEGFCAAPYITPSSESVVAVKP